MQNLIIYSVNLADNVMIGSYSETSLSGVALVNQIQYLLQMMSMGVGEGIIVLCSQYWGKKDISTIRKVIGIGIKLGILISSILFIAVFFFPEQCLGILTDEAPVIEEGAKYLRIICFSYIIFTVTSILIASLRSVETVKIGFLISFSTLCINVCLNYLLIYGNFGCPELGIRGAAIATLTSRIVEFVTIVFYVKVVDKKIRIQFKEWLKTDMALFKDYIKICVPVVLTSSLWGVAMLAQTAILGHISAAAIAANSIATTVFQIVTVGTFGNGSAASVMIGKTIGEGNLDLVKQYAKTFQCLFIFTGFMTSLVLFGLKDIILSFYDISFDTKVLASQFMTVLCISLIGTSYQAPVVSGIIRGGGETKFGFYIDTSFMWLFTIPMGALSAFVFEFPPVVTFICLKLDQWLKCIVAGIKVNRFRWIKQLTRTEIAS